MLFCICSNERNQLNQKTNESCGPVGPAEEKKKGAAGIFVTHSRNVQL